MNVLREKLDKNEVIFGTHVSLNSVVISEIFGRAGFDYIWIDQEHTTLSLEQIQMHMIACKTSGSSSVVRIPWNNPVLLKPILEMGPDGVVIPQVNSYEEAVEAIRAFRYPPNGVRGWGPSRAIDFGRMPMDEYLQSAEEILKVLQIENIRAIEDLDRILTIPEIDILLFGPCDLASSMGKVGQWNNPEVQTIIDMACNKISDAGKKFGVSYGMCDENFVRRWKDRGVSMISLCNDVAFLVQGTKYVMNMYSEVFDKNKVNSSPTN